MVGVRPWQRAELAPRLGGVVVTAAAGGLLVWAWRELAVHHDTALLVVVPVALYAAHAVTAVGVLGAGGLTASDRAALAATALAVAHLLLAAATGRLGTGAAAYAVLIAAPPLPFLAAAWLDQKRRADPARAAEPEPCPTLVALLTSQRLRRAWPRSRGKPTDPRRALRAAPGARAPVSSSKASPFPAGHRGGGPGSTATLEALLRSKRLRHAYTTATATDPARSVKPPIPPGGTPGAPPTPPGGSARSR
jgi:hypothetical protein